MFVKFDMFTASVLYTLIHENGENQLIQGIQKAAGCKINFRHGSRQDALETEILMFSI